MKPYASVMLAALVALQIVTTSPGAHAQAPVRVDTSAIGPQVGSRVPPFSGTDQLGRAHTLESSLGARGLMLVFFRSADW